MTTGPKYSGAAVLVGTLLYTLHSTRSFPAAWTWCWAPLSASACPLTENFRQPFFARSVSDFWRRWHITLGAWLREYVFQPVIVSKPMMRFGRWCRTRFGAALGRSMPVWAGLLLTWLAIGIWHGAGWLYIVYGLYYFVLQWLGEAAEPTLLRLFPALPRWRNHRGYKLWQVVRTFVLVNLGMLIFRSNGTRAALEMLASLARPYTGSLLIKLDIADLGVLAVGAVVRWPWTWPTSGASPSGRPSPAARCRCAGRSTAAPCWRVMIFGAYGDNYDPAAFIYAQF